MITCGDEELKAQLLKAALSNVLVDSKSEFAFNVLQGLAEFYEILSKDGSRDSVTAKKLVLQAAVGSKVRESGQISLVEVRGGRLKPED